MFTTGESVRGQEKGIARSRQLFSVSKIAKRNLARCTWTQSHLIDQPNSHLFSWFYICICICIKIDMKDTGKSALPIPKNPPTSDHKISEMQTRQFVFFWLFQIKRIEISVEIQREGDWKIVWRWLSSIKLEDIKTFLWVSLNKVSNMDISLWNFWDWNHQTDRMAKKAWHIFAENVPTKK